MNDSDFIPADDLKQLRDSARRAWLHPIFMFFLAWVFFSMSANTANEGSAIGAVMLLGFMVISVSLGLWTLKIALKYRELWHEVSEQQEQAIKNESIFMVVEIEDYLSGR